MKATLDNLKALREILRACNQKKVQLFDKYVEDNCIDILDGAIVRLEQEFPASVIYPRPFDLDERDETAQCVARQVDTMTDAMTKLKKRFDKAVVRADYTNELHEVVRDMCMLSEMTIGLAQKLNRF